MQLNQDKRETLGKLTALSLLTWMPWPAWAADVTAPRLALVIGNGSYPRAPLANCTNDAHAIAAALKQVQFAVTLKTDCSQQDMVGAVHAFCREVDRQRAVALFYFAGHGMQIDWHNYLLPVDVALSSAADLPRQAMDVSTLLDGLGKVASAMNIVILDACRDNPFGVANKTGAGLSQMDAPARTLLAYATAPGNVASDGGGKNGLYTQNLLQEMVRPDSRIEDVFKRTRLSVRLQSQGKQIPWESTSLEEDFYFVPPSVVSQPSADQQELLFQKDKADWERAQASGTPQAVQAYLREHPNGHFCEIAQSTLDRLLEQQGEAKVRIQNSAGNPFSKGSADAGRIHLGDRYQYRSTDLLTGEQRRMTQVVTGMTDQLIEFNHGSLRTDLLGNALQDAGGGRAVANQLFSNGYAIGKAWRTRFNEFHPNGQFDLVEFICRVVAREMIVVPAGSFDTFRVEAVGWRVGKPARQTVTYWMAPDRVPRFIAQQRTNYGPRGVVRKSNRVELLSFVPGQG